MVARWVHIPEVVGSIPTLATTTGQRKPMGAGTGQDDGGNCMTHRSEPTKKNTIQSEFDTLPSC